MPKLNNDFINILSKLNGSVWYITKESLDVILGILDKRLNGEMIDGDEVRIMLASQKADHRREYERATVIGGVGILPLYGPIFPKANMMTEYSGATSLQSFRNDFRALMNNDHVQTILMDIDSPGGHSDMIPEMAQEIIDARDIKDIVAVANTGMNSAAYYLGSQASKVYSTPSGQVGSVGTYLVHVDESQALEKQGIKETYISGGRFKTELVGPLGQEARAHLQNYVDQHYGMFVESVAAGRNTTVEEVEANYGQGRVSTAADALSVGMIDGIKPFDEVLGRLIESGGDIRGIESQPVPVPVSPSSLGYVTTQSNEAGKEHSEPGTGQGGEPTPRESPTKGDKAIEGGWRRDPPPPAYETQEAVVNREWLEARATALGIEFSEETTDEALGDLVAEKMNEIIVPLTDATASAQEQQDFARMFPAQAAQMADLLAKDRVNDAKAFADSFRVLPNDSTKGFSTLVREKLTNAHLAISERTFTHADLNELVESLSDVKAAVVPIGEVGSSRTNDEEHVGATRDFVQDRKAFAELVRSAMTEHNLSRNAAIKHVSENNPELAQSYLSGHVKGGN